MRTLCLLSTCTAVLLWPLHSLAMQLGSGSAELPFDFSLQQGTSAFASTVQFHNESAVSTTVLAWQLSLQVQPLPNSQGQVHFESVTLPASPFFGDASSLDSDLLTPSISLLAFDGDILQFV